jgi:hypothetical protein
MLTSEEGLYSFISIGFFYGMWHSCAIIIFHGHGMELNMKRTKLCHV